jgi:hypothetical protein
VSFEFNISFKIGNLTYAESSVAAAFNPPVFEKRSIDKPNKKDTTKKRLLFVFIG